MKRIIFPLLFLFFAAFSCTKMEQIQYPSLENIQSVDDIVAPYLASDETFALSIAIINGEQEQFFHYGNISNKNPQAPDHPSIYEIGSVTKTFTTSVLAAMVREEKVSLDDPISQYLPDGVGNWGDSLTITLEELATHSSGLPRMPANFGSVTTLLHYKNPYKKYTVAQLYEYLKVHKIKEKSKRKVNYSNLGMGLLGHTLALHHGTDYETMVKQYILDKWEMPNTTITLDEEAMKLVVQGHNGRGRPTPLWDIPTLAGAGALRSNITDMAKYVKAHMKEEQFLADTHKARGSMQEGVEIGLAWILTKTPQMKQNIIWHNGGTGGYRSFVGFDKENQLGVVVLSNASVSVDPLGILILEYLAKQKMAD